MLSFKAELQKHHLTLQQIAEKANIEFRQVYAFSNGAFVFVDKGTQEQIITALRALSKHPYQLRDFVYHPNALPPIPIPPPKAPVIGGVRAGKQTIEAVQELKHKKGELQVWAMSIHQTQQEIQK